MGYSIELYFDTTFEKKLLTVWETLAQAGVPSFYQQMKGRPHLTLLVLDEGSEEQLCSVLGEISHLLPKLSLDFPAIALIPTMQQQAVYLAPVITTTLLNMHVIVYERIYASGNVPIDRYRPHYWLPHCGISKQLSALEALQTLDICRQHNIFGSAQVVEIGLTKFQPSHQIQTWSLDSPISAKNR